MNFQIVTLGYSHGAQVGFWDDREVIGEWGVKLDFSARHGELPNS